MSKLTSEQRRIRGANWKRPSNWPSNRRPKFVKQPFFNRQVNYIHQPRIII